ncbi:MAG TPA: DUF1549 and DUF1553 domain-containing protein [Humisphaera sp.]
MRSLATLAVALALVASAITPRASAAQPSDANLAAVIDRHVDARLAQEGLTTADPADDAEFVRRAYLDLAGVVPTLDETNRFLADADPTKRAKLVDALIASPRYGYHLADVWQGYLISPLADDRQARADRFRTYLANEFNTKTWDRIATDLLTATGKMEDNPAVTYLIEGRLPRGVPDLTDLTSRYFLGVRLNCAQCHDHPFVDWKQGEFWGMAAFFTQVQTPKRAKQVYEKGVVDDPKLTLASLKDAGAPDGFQLRPPTYLGGKERQPADGPTDRAALAAWMTAPDNRYFARAIVNRTWWRLLGRGLVAPVDDMHDGHAPSHPELLDELSRRFVTSGFDLKALTRAIATSRAYGRTSRPGDAPERQAALFGRMSVKVLSAGQLYDSLEAILGSPAKIAGVDPRRARAEFTEFFGDAADPDPTAYRRGIPHLLRQMNSGQFAGRNLDALVDRLAPAAGRPAAGRPTDEVATDLFLTILSRKPTPDELKQFAAYAATAGSPKAAARELGWVLLLTGEFSLNH